MDLKGAIADHMGHFSAYDIPGVLFVLVSSALFGYFLARWGARATVADARKLALWAGSAALATALVRSQLPVAMVVLAAVLLVGKRPESNVDGAVFFSALLIGIGCGSGATVIVGVAMIPYFFLIRWVYRPAIRR